MTGQGNFKLDLDRCTHVGTYICIYVHTQARRPQMFVIEIEKVRAAITIYEARLPIKEWPGWAGKEKGEGRGKEHLQVTPLTNKPDIFSSRDS